MKKKNYKLINKKMHRKQFKILITLFLSFCFCIQFSYSIDYITVWPLEIKFDYDNTGYSNDAVTLKEDNYNYVPVPEWEYNEGQEISVAYIKGQSNRKIKVRFDSNCESMHLLINLNVVSGTGIGEICNFFVVNYNTQEEEEYWITLTLDGSIPNSVGERNFTWKWEIYAIPNDPDYCSAMSYNETDHSYYTLLAAPQDPMDEPWSSVLDYACDWASGQSTVSGVKSSLTNSLYSSGVEYNPSEHYTKDSKTNLHLTSLLNDLSDDPEEMQMDCRDFANFIHVLSNALGVTGEYYIIYHISTNPPYYVAFLYNYLYPAGWTEKEYPDYWNFHQVGWYSSKVADASTKIDNDSDPTSSPHDWKLVIGDMTITDYNNQLSENSLKGGGTGTCTVY